ncbi:MAG TPA: DUF2252 family protein [Myxococcales bacterium LLY-WYZ-16_1]|nr:DUF2252 family protein [Myxococcales bacterium LLY-WYZ-16_1]
MTAGMTWVGTAELAARVCCALVVVGCAHGGSRAPESEAAPNPLRVPVDGYDFRANPKLLQRIRSDPHGYFRFINRTFSQAVCDRFDDLVRVLPSVNLHGDAHLEQYAVTRESRGLTDFDDSTTGPAVIDLMRLGVSIALAAEMEGWGAYSDRFFDRFLDGYRASLEDPQFEAPVPTLVASLRKNFEEDPRDFFDWVDSVIVPVDVERMAELQDALEPYIARMVALDDNEANDPAYFRIEKAGLLNLGIGSALDEKYLLQVRGPTDAPSDDVVLELKEVRDLRGVTCLEGTQKIDPFRILVGQSRIAYTPYRFIGYIRHQGRTFWIHSWVMNYRELDLPEMVRRPELLEEILFDIGVQLGRGHPYQIAAPLDAELRRELRSFVDGNHDRLHYEINEMTAQLRKAWTTFVEQSRELAESTRQEEMNR